LIRAALARAPDFQRTIHPALLPVRNDLKARFRELNSGRCIFFANHLSNLRKGCGTVRECQHLNRA
jgi:hypothetical protein